MFSARPVLKYQHIMPGTFIRAYDCEPYNGDGDMFIEGEVMRHGVHPTQGYPALVVMCMRDSTISDDICCGVRGSCENCYRCRVGNEIYVPMQITHEFDGRIKINIDPNVSFVA